ncbi:tRNA 2-selenouridine(34) synthase MnmH [Vallitalea okinawensis]|uniref:tRNA 2-selenouridine(34) synthase MnmH n=1 Tax=Vallitalea okinawensis TaxID=2078660 RepID=UPI000CFBA98C|nr:tRNA 2-selenouridine(34) synthase MnmH [Vallitalea okinawensis]
MKTITYDDSLNLKDVLYVDVRSEGEFQEGTITDAKHLPLYDNEERAYLGHTYKNIGKQTAKEKGLEIAATKLSHLYKQLKDLSKDYNHIVIFCWRGGMRSRSVTAVMDVMQLNVYQLEGGYKAYRQHVLQQFDQWREKPLHFVALHGNTGSGKTLLLEKLEKLDLPVLNLEKLANHRGSVFGDIGLGQQPSQKTFEADLFSLTSDLENSPIFVEAENPKIGKRMLPQFIVEGIKEGIHIHINCDLDIRIQRLVHEYTQTDHDDNHADIYKALGHIQPFMSRKDYDAIKTAIDEDDLHTAAKHLLDLYYDPRYNQWRKLYDTFHYEVDTTDLDNAAEKFKEIYVLEKDRVNAGV